MPGGDSQMGAKTLLVIQPVGLKRTAKFPKNPAKAAALWVILVQAPLLRSYVSPSP